MPDPLYTYILNIYELLTHFVDNILKLAYAYFFAYSKIVSSIAI